MITTKDIQDAINQYDASKNILRQIIGDPEAIKRVKDCSNTFGSNDNQSQNHELTLREQLSLAHVLSLANLDELFDKAQNLILALTNKIRGFYETEKTTLILALDHLAQRKLYIPTVLQAMQSHADLPNLISALAKLKKPSYPGPFYADILTADTFNELMQSQDPTGIVDIWIILTESVGLRMIEARKRQVINNLSQPKDALKVLQTYSEKYGRIIYKSNIGGLVRFDDEILMAVSDCKKLTELAKVFDLWDKDQLIPTYFTDIAAFDYPDELAHALLRLKEFGILTEPNIAVIKLHIQGKGFKHVDVLIQLIRANKLHDLPTKITKLINTCSQYDKLAVIFEKLLKYNLFDNIESIFTSFGDKLEILEKVLSAFPAENNEFHLTQAHFNFVTASVDPVRAAAGLVYFIDHPILNTPENIGWIQAHPKPFELMYVMHFLCKAGSWSGEQTIVELKKIKPEYMAGVVLTIAQFSACVSSEVSQRLLAHVIDNQNIFGVDGVYAHCYDDLVRAQKMGEDEQGFEQIVYDITSSLNAPVNEDPETVFIKIKFFIKSLIALHCAKVLSHNKTTFDSLGFNQKSYIGGILSFAQKANGLSQEAFEIILKNLDFFSEKDIAVIVDKIDIEDLGEDELKRCVFEAVFSHICFLISQKEVSGEEKIKQVVSYVEKVIFFIPIAKIIYKQDLRSLFAKNFDSVMAVSKNSMRGMTALLKRIKSGLTQEALELILANPYIFEQYSFELFFSNISLNNYPDSSVKEKLVMALLRLIVEFFIKQKIHNAGHVSIDDFLKPLQARLAVAEVGFLIKKIARNEVCDPEHIMTILNLDVKFINYMDEVIEKLMRKNLGTKENIEAVLNYYKVADKRIAQIMQSDWVYELICENRPFVFLEMVRKCESAELSDNQKLAAIEEYSNKLALLRVIPKDNKPNITFSKEEMLIILSVDLEKIGKNIGSVGRVLGAALKCKALTQKIMDKIVENAELFGMFNATGAINVIAVNQLMRKEPNFSQFIFDEIMNVASARPEFVCDYIQKLDDLMPIIFHCTSPNIWASVRDSVMALNPQQIANIKKVIDFAVYAHIRVYENNVMVSSKLTEVFEHVDFFGQNQVGNIFAQLVQTITAFDRFAISQNGVQLIQDQLSEIFLQLIAVKKQHGISMEATSLISAHLERMSNVVNIIFPLSIVGLFNIQYKYIITNIEANCLGNIAKIIIRLHLFRIAHHTHANFLTQQNVNRILEHQMIFGASVVATEFANLTDNQINQTMFNQVFLLCNNQDIDQAIAAVANYLVNLQQAQIVHQLNQGPADFNHAQSTHTASIHKTVSKSAARLEARYGKPTPELLAKIFTEMKEWLEDQVERNKQRLNALSKEDRKILSLSRILIDKYHKEFVIKEHRVSKFKTEYEHHANLLILNNIKIRFKIIPAALRGFERITAANYEFVDPASKVHTQELLALAWLAIHDDKNREGTLVDAEQQLIQGLYEIQRGYNLSINGVDMGGEDYFICPGGTFNKIMEKLIMHKDVVLVFVSKKTATLKFHILIKEEAAAYLLQQANPSTKEDYEAFQKLLKQIDENGLEAIWEHIKSIVSEKMYEEFGPDNPAIKKCPIFRSKESHEFIEFINQGIYVEFELPDYKQVLINSKGYQAYCATAVVDVGVFSSSSTQVLSLPASANEVSNANGEPIAEFPQSSL